MKTSILFSIVALTAASLVAAESSPKDDVSSAAKALGEKANYSWKTTVAVPPDSQYHPGPTEGKTEKDGATRVKMTFGDNTSEIVLQGGKSAVHTEDGGWQSPSELDDQGAGRFLGAMVRNFKAPAAQAAEIASQTKELKKDGDAYSGDLTEEGAKALLQFRRGGNATVSDAKGSVKFWIQDGVLTKYEYKVTGKVSFNGNDRDVDRTTTTEIKDVGATKVEVPDDAKKKLA
ncbi:MAG TPA: hypothetical protein VH597_06135 [Verrucomicrobiae bacterium]|jgi:hypothetical protein|nr:hypothetical protein [Verrucomicrobiae bacterium]